VRVGGEEGDADAHAGGEGARADAEAIAVGHNVQRVGQGQRIALRSVRQNAGEFVTTEAGKACLWRHRLAQLARQLLQHPVARHVPAGVVDELELIEVEVEQRVRQWRSCGNSFPEARLQLVAVVDSRQQVVMGEMKEAFRRLFALPPHHRQDVAGGRGRADEDHADGVGGLAGRLPADTEEDDQQDRARRRYPRYAAGNGVEDDDGKEEEERRRGGLAEGGDPDADDHEEERQQQPSPEGLPRRERPVPPGHQWDEDQQAHRIRKAERQSVPEEAGRRSGLHGPLAEGRGRAGHDGGEQRAAGEDAEVAHALEIARDAEARHHPIEDEDDQKLDPRHDQGHGYGAGAAIAQDELADDDRRPPPCPECPQHRRSEAGGGVDETDATPRLQAECGQADQGQQRGEDDDLQ
jgi:hypothetical protein